MRSPKRPSLCPSPISVLGKIDPVVLRQDNVTTLGVVRQHQAPVAGGADVDFSHGGEVGCGEYPGDAVLRIASGVPSMPDDTRRTSRTWIQWGCSGDMHFVKNFPGSG